MEPTLVPEAARRFAIGFLFITHIQFAALIIGVLVLAVSMEFFWIINPRDPNLERLSRGMGKYGAIAYSTGAVLAFGVMFFLSIFWPTFWYAMFRFTFYAFLMEAITFILTILYLFPWFFTWGVLERFRWVHVALGALLLVAINSQQTLINVAASYMMTSTPAPSFMRLLYNPTMVPLDMHRIVGDISFAGFVLAGFSAFMTLRARTDKDRAFYDWIGSVGLIAGVGFMYLQPAIGIGYASEIRWHSPAGFNTMFRGRNSWLFLLQVTFLSILFLCSMMYMILQTRKSRRPGVPILWSLFIIASMSALLLVNPYVIGPSQEYRYVDWVNPVGSMQPWKYIALAGMTLSAIGGVFVYLGAQRSGMRWGYLAEGGRAAQYLLLVLAVFASFMMALMGYIRENSRIPFLIYNKILLDQPQEFMELRPTPTPVPTPTPTPTPTGPTSLRLPRFTYDDPRLGQAIGPAAYPRLGYGEPP